jgi:Fur family ferric uptake transcriptional regulator
MVHKSTMASQKTGWPRRAVAFKPHVQTRPRAPETAMTDTIISRCEAKGLRMTGQRRTIAQVLEDSSDHPDVEELYARASALDAGISIATVYRTVKLFEEAGILERVEFGDGRARYEDAERDHHDHLIDMNSGEVIEFVDPEIEALQEKIAAKLGYELRGHRLELYGVPIRKR